ncbi:uncharacterized protein LOC120158501 isoform X2 [Hibiscus syriacus]|uniref:uncharacterized protein LOC120158501 isoform X2 n=1 Tax=Hibiscus syriacus TaxID=106335 RepID=UPI001921E9F5|nr:uncharacterized protein LOC120158501 isoform X2 [Hibiscus syriacus]
MDTLITRIPNASALDSDDSNRLDLTLKMDMQRPKGYRIFRILTPMMTPTKLLLFLLPVTLRTSQLPAKTRNRTQKSSVEEDSTVLSIGKADQGVKDGGFVGSYKVQE